MILRWFALIALFVTFNTAHSQQLYFYLNDASVQIYSIDEVRRIDFDAENIHLLLLDETTVTYEYEVLNYYRYFPEGVTSINNESARADFSLFPNPTENQLNVKFSLLNSANLRIQLQTLQGVKVLEKEFKAEKDSELQLDVSSLSAGQYLCTIEAGGVLISKSFMKR